MGFVPHSCIFSGTFLDEEIVIGQHQKIPWINEPYAKNDLRFFKKMTCGEENNNVVICGKNTAMSIPKFPLPNRTCIVVSTSFTSSSNVIIVSTLEEALKKASEVVQWNMKKTMSYANALECSKRIWVIGGSSLYTESINRKDCMNIYITLVPFYLKHKENIVSIPNVTREGDKWTIGTTIWNQTILSNQEMNGVCIYRLYPKNIQEETYLTLLQKIMNKGTITESRAGRTKRLLMEHIRFDIRKGIPVLTTKKMFMKGIWKELCWFLLGYTNNTILSNEGVHIWNGNSTREYLDSLGGKHISRPEHCCGPIYGYQWRNFNYPYHQENEMSNKAGRMHKHDVPLEQDQLMSILFKCIHHPNDRRMIMSGWNPEQQHEMCLPPCHLLYQFFVEGESKKVIHLSMYQRSADFFLGVPFNITSCSLLMFIVATICNMDMGDLMITFGDLHIYEDHLDPNVVPKQIQQTPYHFPKLDDTDDQWNTFISLLQKVYQPIVDKNIEEANQAFCRAMEFGLHIVPKLNQYVHGPIIKARMNV